MDKEPPEVKAWVRAAYTRVGEVVYSGIRVEEEANSFRVTPLSFGAPRAGAVHAGSASDAGWAMLTCNCDRPTAALRGARGGLALAGNWVEDIGRVAANRALTFAGLGIWDLRRVAANRALALAGIGVNGHGRGAALSWAFAVAVVIRVGYLGRIAGYVAPPGLPIGAYPVGIARFVGWARTRLRHRLNPLAPGRVL